MKNNNFKDLAVIINNVRSCENVGSILRTADFFGFKYVWFIGVTPCPTLKTSKKPPSQSSPYNTEEDNRLPHVREKLDKKIKKVSLGAEDNLTLIYEKDLKTAVAKLKDMNWKIIGLEQNSNSVSLDKYKTPDKKIAVVLGTEVTGLDFDDLKLVDEIVEIPRSGKKESLNVSVAFGIAASYISR